MNIIGLLTKRQYVVIWITIIVVLFIIAFGDLKIREQHGFRFTEFWLLGACIEYRDASGSQGGYFGANPSRSFALEKNRLRFSVHIYDRSIGVRSE